MHSPAIVTPRAYRIAGLVLGVALLAAAAVSPAHAALSSVSNSTTGATCSGGGSSDGDCRNSVGFSTPSNGTTFTSRYAWNINADVGVASTHDTSGTAKHNVSFTAVAPGGYSLQINTSRVGAMGRRSDVSGCDGAADVGGVTGTTNIALTSGSLNLADPGNVGNGGGDSSTPYSQSSSAQIIRSSNGVGQSHTLTFTWSGSVRSNSCEASVRQGESEGTVTGCDVCGYPGDPGRTQASDGHFVSVTFTSLCGNGAIDASVGEQCDNGGLNGQPGSCCTSSCQIAANGSTCRAQASVCDVAETCNGSSPTCPADAAAPGGASCRASAGICDVEEFCDGTNPLCPTDTFVVGGVTCHASTGLCDPAETCTGSAAACPADELAPAGTECRAASGLCDQAETCTGTSSNCPADGVKSAGSTCRAAAGVCDVAELCNGTTKTCPANAFEPVTTQCRGAANACDIAELCTGISAACPGDSVSPDSDGDGFCDAVDNCDGNPGAQVDSDGDGMGDACDPCNNTLNVVSTKTKIVVQKINTPPGDDKLTYSGQAVVPGSPTINPVANGARIVLQDKDRIALMDAILPGGAYDKNTKIGWKVNKKGDAWTYINRGASPISGVTGVTLKKSATAPGLVKWTVRAKNASLAITPARIPLGATFVVDSPTAETGQCAEIHFGVGVCRLNPTSSTVLCK
jgi:hypothetical protein